MNTTEQVKVGDGATFSIGSDRYPYTVVEVVNDRKVIVQRDDYRRTDKNGFSESQTNEYTPNLEARRQVITKRKNGGWYEQGQAIGSGRFSLGVRRAYQDPCF